MAPPRPGSCPAAPSFPSSPSTCFSLLLVACPAWRRTACCWGWGWLLCFPVAPRGACLVLRVRQRLRVAVAWAGPQPCPCARADRPCLLGRWQGKDVEAPLVHPDRQLLVLLRVHHGERPALRGLLPGAAQGCPAPNPTGQLLPWGAGVSAPCCAGLSTLCWEQGRGVFGGPWGAGSLHGGSPCRGQRGFHKWSGLGWAGAGAVGASGHGPLWTALVCS